MGTTPQERPEILCKQGWVDLEASLDGHGKSRPNWDWIHGPFSP